MSTLSCSQGNLVAMLICAGDGWEWYAWHMLQQPGRCVDAAGRPRTMQSTQYLVAGEESQPLCSAVRCALPASSSELCCRVPVLQVQQGPTSIAREGVTPHVSRCGMHCTACWQLKPVLHNAGHGQAAVECCCTGAEDCIAEHCSLASRSCNCRVRQAVRLGRHRLWH